MAPLVQERTHLLPEAGEQVRFLFGELAGYDQGSWEKVMTKEEVPGVLDAGLTTLSAIDSWEADVIETALRALPAELGIGAARVFQPLRVAVTGSSMSPPLFESMAALGRAATLERLQEAREELG
jgi:glutamyl-tRNA synthetase